MFPQIHLIQRQLSSKIPPSLSSTKKLHASIAKTHLSRDPYHVTHLVRAYEFHGELCLARKLFDQSSERSVFLWNSIIRAHARARRFSDAFSLFWDMSRSDVCSDGFTYACLARACSDIFHVHGLKLLHAKALVSGYGSDSICSSAFVSAYSKLCLVSYADKVFSGIGKPDLVLWNSMISGYGSCGLWDKGLEFFNDMRRMGEKPDGYTIVGLLSGVSCSSLVDIGQAIHGFCSKSGFETNLHIASSLVSMYAKCKSLNFAHKVFCGISEPDLVTWSALIAGFSQSGDHEKALLFLKELTFQGKKQDSVLTATALAVASQTANVKLGTEIHGYVFRHGLESDVMVGSSLVDMYSKSGHLRLGISVFETMPRKNIVSYNSLISGYGLHGLPTQAFETFKRVLHHGLHPDESTFSALLCACCHSGLVEDGKNVMRAMREEFLVQPRTEHYVHLVKLLGMNGRLEEAYNLVRSLPEPVEHGIWGALFSCCDAHGDSNLAEVVAQRLIESKPEKSAYKVMVSNAYVCDGRWDEAMKVRQGQNWKTPGISRI